MIKKDNIPLFHHYDHIYELNNVASKLLKKFELSEREEENLMIAVWFYYTGFSKKFKNFMDESTAYARKFMEKESYDEKQIKEVESLILSDCHSESSISAQLLHDVIVSYKGRKRFFRMMELLRVERETLMNKSYTDHLWEKIAFNHLVNCAFYTKEAKKSFQKRKIKNINKQRDLIDKALKKTVRKKTGKEFGRGVDTLYRSNYNNHINLSSIADGKANMMISINTIILSVIVTLSGAGFTFSGTFSVDHLRYTIPIMLLLLGSLTSVIFAIMSARPKVTNHVVDMQDIHDGKSSLLFFGNFIQVDLNTYVNHLGSLKKDQQRLYDSMSIDMYHLGLILQKKYKLLTYSYNSFMISVSISVIAFIYIFFHTNSPF
ncbi:MAG: Pycsar system effector family protein [Cyclobacteriaceae bacterium]